jgi:hypothetical protein
LAEASSSDLDLLIFGSLDGGASSFLTAGVKITPKSSPHAGPAMLMSVGGGAGFERLDCGCGVRPMLGHYAASASAVFGYQWSFSEGVVALFAGPEGVMNGHASDAGVYRRDAGIGLRVHAEAWLHPTAATLLQASLIAGTARDSVWSRLAWGYRAWSAYAGPEAGLYADATGYAKASLGLHVTGLSYAATTFRVSAGAQYEPRDSRLSAYLGLTAWRPW